MRSTGSPDNGHDPGSISRFNRLLSSDSEAKMPGMREAAIGVLVALRIGFVPASVQAAPDEAAEGALTAAYNTTGQQLFRKLAQAPGNIVLSPFSLSSPLA